MPNDALSDAADPVPRSPGGVPDPDRSARARHWVGISSLAGAIALAAIAVPPLLVPDERRPDGVGSAAPDGTVDPTTTATLPGGAPTTAPGAAGSGPTTGPTPPSRAPDSTPQPAGSLPGPAPNRPTRTAAPPPSATTGDATPPASFRPVSVEAEDPGNLLSEGAGIVGCAACAGGARVRYLGRLTAYLTTATAGERTITVSYSTKGDRQLKISINGAAPTTHHLTGTAWDTPRTFQYAATVPAGRVSFIFYNDTGPPPDIDKISIS